MPYSTTDNPSSRQREARHFFFAARHLKRRHSLLKPALALGAANTGLNPNGQENHGAHGARSFVGDPLADVVSSDFPFGHQGSGCIIHLNIATCKWLTLVWKKPHVTQLVAQHGDLLRSPVQAFPKVETPSKRSLRCPGPWKKEIKRASTFWGFWWTLKENPSPKKKFEKGGTTGQSWPYPERLTSLSLFKLTNCTPDGTHLKPSLKISLN